MSCARRVVIPRMTTLLTDASLFDAFGLPPTL
jgi:hypothetical protein